MCVFHPKTTFIVLAIHELIVLDSIKLLSKLIDICLGHNELTHCSLGGQNKILDNQFQN